MIISSFRDARFWDISTADYRLAFKSIQQLDLSLLDRAQSSQLANRILHVLLRAKILSLAKAAEHTTVLTKLTLNPNKSMDILTDTQMSSSKELKQSEGEIALIQLARGVDGFMKWSIDNIHSLEILQRLAGSVTRSATPSN